MKKELFRFIESIPATAGYANYELFHEGSIVYIEESFPWKWCILCDEEGNFIPNDEGERIFLDWCPSFEGYPVWEDKLELFKEVEDTQHHFFEEILSKRDFLDIVKSLPDTASICLDIDGSTTYSHLQKYGKDNVLIILEKGKTRLIAVNVPNMQNGAPDINELFNSLQDIDHITINFHQHD